ncbi:hypothetical protein Y032_0093g2671 [Ancylostoma ceylanicum]|nr:hypothetical protein Y032_0093g2671 [Ancylostoma ceylanicum]
MPREGCNRQDSSRLQPTEAATVPSFLPSRLPHCPAAVRLQLLPSVVILHVFELYSAIHITKSTPAKSWSRRTPGHVIIIVNFVVARRSIIDDSMIHTILILITHSRLPVEGAEPTRLMLDMIRTSQNDAASPEFMTFDKRAVTSLVVGGGLDCIQKRSQDRRNVNEVRASCLTMLTLA